MTALGIDIGGSSVKLALLRGGECLSTAQGDRYRLPDRAALITSIRSAFAQLAIDRIDACGLCAPGLVNPHSTVVERSVNIPDLVGTSLTDLVTQAITFSGRLSIITDVHAAAHDFWIHERLSGRLLSIALGTGVGACVLDNGVPLRISGLSSGHFGQMDVGLTDLPLPTAPDGGLGGLEGYVGLRSLESRFGTDLAAVTLTPGDPALRALAKAIRIAHAIYRPDHIRLAGGVGLVIARSMVELDRLVREGLTSLAKSGWTLGSAADPFAAARGAARIAAGSDDK